MKNARLIVLLTVSAILPGASALASVAPDNTSAAALEKLRSLAGDWEGSFQWTGARADSGPMKASWYVTGNGSAVVENLVVEGTPAMTSVYHRDGDDLRMTHFCAAQNQPRLKASRIDLARGALDFAFVDITNLSSPDAPHVVGLEMRFLAADHVMLTFLFQAAGRSSREAIDLRRVAAASHS